MGTVKMYPKMAKNGLFTSDMMIIFAQAAAFIYR